jgi:hypothetical protein
LANILLQEIVPETDEELIIEQNEHISIEPRDEIVIESDDDFTFNREENTDKTTPSTIGVSSTSLVTEISVVGGFRAEVNFLFNPPSAGEMDQFTERWDYERGKFKIFI